jgi:hypothetical protein
MVPLSERWSSWRFRTPDPFQVLVFVGALAVAAALAVAVTRPSAGGGHASLGAAGLRQKFDPPVAMPADGEYVRSRVLTSGDVKVVHWIRSTTLIYQLTLSVPTSLRSGGENLFASRVKVEGDGVAQYGPTKVGRRESYFLQGVSTLQVSYVLSGALVRSSSTNARALMRTTTLDLNYTLDTGPRVVSVSGARILAAACSHERAGGTASIRPCGTSDGRGWRVHLGQDERHDAVLVQLDLTMIPPGAGMPSVAP